MSRVLVGLWVALRSLPMQITSNALRKRRADRGCRRTRRRERWGIGGRWRRARAQFEESHSRPTSRGSRTTRICSDDKSVKATTRHESSRKLNLLDIGASHNTPIISSFDPFARPPLQRQKIKVNAIIRERQRGAARAALILASITSTRIASKCARGRKCRRRRRAAGEPLERASAYRLATAAATTAVTRARSRSLSSSMQKRANHNRAGVRDN